MNAERPEYRHPDLVGAVRSSKQYLTYVASGPFQYAVAETLRLPDAYFTAFRDDLRAKRDLLSAGLTDAGLTVFRSTGTYFVTTDIQPLGESDGLAFCRALPERAGVVVIPNAVFYGHKEVGAPYTYWKRRPPVQVAVRTTAEALTDTLSPSAVTPRSLPVGGQDPADRAASPSSTLRSAKQCSASGRGCWRRRYGG